jgi:G3E family GTPase
LCDAFGLESAPVIVILNPKRVKQSHPEQLPFFTDLIDHADIRVGNRMDQCDEAERGRFAEWTQALQPPKRMIVETSFGRLPEAAFSTRPASGPGVFEMLKRALSDRAAPHTHPEYSGGFSESWDEAVSSERFRRRLESWVTDGLSDAAVLRFKALLPTDQGWQLFEIADGSVYQRTMPGSGGVRVDWITEKPVAADRVREALRKCLEAT